MRKLLWLVSAVALMTMTAKGARAQSHPNLSGTWTVSLGEWTTDTGAQVNMNGQMAAIVLTVQGDSVFGNTKSPTGQIGKDTLRGAWSDGKITLSRALNVKRQSRDETGAVTSEDETGKAQFTIELVPDGEQLKGTIRIVSPDHVVTAPLTATRAAASGASSSPQSTART